MQFLEEFEERKGSYLCRDLLGCDLSTEEGRTYAKAHGLFGTLCPEMVRTAAEIVGDAGSTSCVNLAPNGRVYEENDIQYLVNQGYSVEAAIEVLSGDEKYTKPGRIAPNGKIYEQNDIDYLLGQGYTKDAAIAFLATADKYLR